MSLEYAQHKFGARSCEWDEESGEKLDPDVGNQVKAIVLSDEFWKGVVDVLRIAMPLIKLLRMLDGNKPVLGKIYDRMFNIGETLKTMQNRVPWYVDPTFACFPMGVRTFAYACPCLCLGS